MLKGLIVLIGALLVVGCEQKSIVSDETLSTIKAWSYQDGYFAGHKDKSDGFEISTERASALSKEYVKEIN